jgi:hypothetical protein
MNAPRRRLVRTAAPPAAPDPARRRRLQKLRARLEKEQAALARWMARLLCGGSDYGELRAATLVPGRKEAARLRIIHSLQVVEEA